MATVRVEVEARQWLRAKAEAYPFVLKMNVVKRLLRVGQGPQEFLQRLINTDFAHLRFVPWPLRGDASLFLIRASGARASAAERRKIPKIVRLDGIGLDDPSFTREEYCGFRTEMQKTLKEADAIVYQSEFSKRSFEAVYGVAEVPVAVICNGAPDALFAKNYEVDKLIDSNRLVVAGRDSPRKRITETVRRFIESPFSNHYELVVVGDIQEQEKVEHKNIRYLGRLLPSELFIVLKHSRGLIHLDWYDWCPNLVVEAIANRIPVLCGAVGGTQELVRETGLIAELGDSEPDFSNLKQIVPNIKQDKFNQALELFLDKTSGEAVGLREDLMMSRVARKYYEFIKTL